MKYRKKPVVVEAIRFTGMNHKEIFDFCPKAQYPDDALIIKTLEGNMIADEGDWIIKGVKGEFYPCKDDIFRMTYEEVNSREVIRSLIHEIQRMI